MYFVSMMDNQILSDYKENWSRSYVHNLTMYLYKFLTYIFSQGHLYPKNVCFTPDWNVNVFAFIPGKNCHSYQKKIVIHTRKKCINVCQYICQDYITQCDPLSLMIDVTLCHLMSITIFTHVTYDHTLLSVSLSLLLRCLCHCHYHEISKWGGLILCYCYSTDMTTSAMDQSQ